MRDPRVLLFIWSLSWSIQACWWPSRSRLAKLPAKTMPNIYGSSGERLTLELGPFRFQANLTLLLLLSVYDSARTLGQRTRVRMHMLGQFSWLRYTRSWGSIIHPTYFVYVSLSILLQSDCTASYVRIYVPYDVAAWVTFVLWNPTLYTGGHGN
jgi:hypothetical protein